MENPNNESKPGEDGTEKSETSGFRKNPKTRKLFTYWTLITVLAFVAGSVGGYFTGIRQHAHTGTSLSRSEALLQQINPPEGYRIAVSFGNVGPALLNVGAIDKENFLQLYAQSGSPLSTEEMGILQEGSTAQVVISQENARFLLNLFWALGLANENRILTEGPMVSGGRENVVNFASTGGWTLASRPVADVYASSPIVVLTEEQQNRLEDVVKTIYRPCCDNSVYFPDCNHGMAMLGLMELMASQGASADEMLQAAKYANAYWYPQQTLELAVYFNDVQDVVFAQADARQLVGKTLSSLTGFRALHQWLLEQGLLPTTTGGSNSCSV